MPAFPDPFAPPPPAGQPAPPPAPGPDPYAPQYPTAPGLAGYGPPPSTQSNAIGVLALVLGVAAIPLGVCCGVLGGALGVAGVVLGLIGMRKADEGQATNRGMAIAGAICGGVGILVSILAFVASFAITPGLFGA